jgi:hypothetical protein
MGPFPEAVEADIAHYYPGRSVAQFWRGEMTLRALRVLVANLPPDSATTRAIRGHAWTDRDYMLADLLDTVRYHRVEWATSRGAKPGKPKPVNRPVVPDQGTGSPGHPSGSPPTERAMAMAAHQHVLDQIMPRRALPGPPPDDPPTE